MLSDGEYAPVGVVPTVFVTVWFGGRSSEWAIREPQKLWLHEAGIAHAAANVGVVSDALFSERSGHGRFLS
jgi:hypothetical protein